MEIEKTKRAVEDVAGVRMRLFRPPFGVTNPIIGRVIRSLGLQTVGWNVRSFDTFEKKDRDAVCKHIKRKLCNGSVILLHDRCKDADILLEYVLKEIKACNMQVVMLDRLFEIKAYEN